jgi:hypothetical protein
MRRPGVRIPLPPNSASSLRLGEATFGKPDFDSTSTIGAEFVRRSLLEFQTTGRSRTVVRDPGRLKLPTSLRRPSSGKLCRASREATSGRPNSALLKIETRSRSKLIARDLEPVLPQLLWKIEIRGLAPGACTGRWKYPDVTAITPKVFLLADLLAAMEAAASADSLECVVVKS